MDIPAGEVGFVHLSIGAVRKGRGPDPWQAVARRVSSGHISHLIFEDKS